MLERFLSILLLGIFMLVNLAMFLMRPFVGAGTAVWRRVFKVEMAKDEKKSYEIAYTIIWFTVGTWAAWRLKGAGVLAEFFGFLAFRSGANITRTMVYGLHDQGVLKIYSEGALLSIIESVLKFSLLIETIFLASFALAYKTLSIMASSGMSVGGFILYLWAVGLVFGAIFGWFKARNNRGMLLQSAIPVVLFFSARTGKKRTESTAGKIKSGSKSISSRLRGFR